MAEVALAVPSFVDRYVHTEPFFRQHLVGAFGVDVGNSLIKGRFQRIVALTQRNIGCPEAQHATRKGRSGKNQSICRIGVDHRLERGDICGSHVKPTRGQFQPKLFKGRIFTDIKALQNRRSQSLPRSIRFARR